MMTALCFRFTNRPRYKSLFFFSAALLNNKEALCTEFRNFCHSRHREAAKRKKKKKRQAGGELALLDSFSFCLLRIQRIGF